VKHSIDSVREKKTNLKTRNKISNIKEKPEGLPAETSADPGPANPEDEKAGSD